MVPDSLEKLLAAWSHASSSVATLLDVSEEEQRRRGYFHTLREIAQQPLTWPSTVRLARIGAAALRERLALVESVQRDPRATVLLTGSGSSFYVGASLEPVFRREMAASVRAVAAGDLLTDLDEHVPRDRPCLVLSFARSGNSPESCGAVDQLLAHRAQAGHIVFTSNPEGNLARRYHDEPRVTTILLDQRTNERSLVMTSGFTNMWLAARTLLRLDDDAVATDTEALSAACWRILVDSTQALAELCESTLPRVGIFLGRAARHGAACEGALKILEMTDGRVPTLAHTFLSLRHGPMCAVGEDALLVSLLSPSSPASHYERDLFLELEDKGLEPRRVFVGTPGPRVKSTDRDVIVPVGPSELDDELAILGVVVSQLLGFFLSLRLGLSPDAPSKRDIITRVVRNFEIYPR